MSVLIGGLYFLVCVTIVISRPDVDIESRIVGGSKAADNAFPYQVSLRTNNQHFCGGSVISKLSILTAAHCIYGNNNPMTAVVGTNKLSSNGVAYQVVQAMYHQAYDPQTTINDVAVLRVGTEISFELVAIQILNVSVVVGQPVTKVILSNATPADGSIATLSGWGLTSYPGSIPDDLQQINLSVLDLQTCAERLQGANPITTGNVCTTSPINQGACQGDSGGPLVDQNGRQIGIVSWGIPCAKGLPDVFTSVAFYSEWIAANTA